MEVVVPEEFRYLYEPGTGSAVVKVPSAVLRAVAAPVAKVNRNVEVLVERLLKNLKDANGIGLAAPQIGVSLRVVIIAPPKHKPVPLINPVVLRTAGEEVGVEGCLSIPGLYGEVRRADFAEVQALDRRGKPVHFELEGLAARIALHEIDHLDGVLFIDRADPATLHWEHPAGAGAAA
jgi:peptide deformylase